MGNDATNHECAGRRRWTPTRCRAILLVLAVALVVPSDAEAGRKKSRSGKIGKARSRVKRSHSRKKRSGGGRSRGSRSTGSGGRRTHGSRSAGSGTGRSHGYVAANPGDQHVTEPGHHFLEHHPPPLSSDALLVALLFPYSLPRLAVGDRSQPFDFYAYPYEQPNAGPHRMLTAGVKSRRPVQLRLLTSYERESSNLDARRIQLSVRTNRRWDVDVGLTRYSEKLDGGRTDQMWQWKAMVLRSFAISSRARFSAGAGVRGFRFAGGERSTGFAVRYAAELFPVKPLRLWAIGELGMNSRELSGEVDVGAGVLVNRFELFAGYRNVRFVGVNFGGPVVGVAARF